MSSDRVQRAAYVVFGAAAVGVAGWMALEANEPRPARREAVSDAGPADAAVPLEAGATPASSASATAEPADAGLFLPSLSFDASTLPVDAPKRIRVGIVLVTFEGADGAPKNARPKAAARALAERLAEEAQGDFKKAVQGGDPGSDADFGRLERGLLQSEPQAENAVFSLESGAVSGVIETSRGYWIVKRID